MGEHPTEIGFVMYPGVQMAAVLGMTDLFTVADGLARKKRQDSRAPSAAGQPLAMGAR